MVVLEPKKKVHSSPLTVNRKVDDGFAAKWHGRRAQKEEEG